MTLAWKNFITQLGLATVGTIFVATIVKVKPSQAASFTFTFSNNNSFDNRGSLSFSNDSILLGVGREIANLSDLPNAAFSLDFTAVLPLGGGGPRVASGFSFSNPTFEFDNGNLIGINGSSSVPVNTSDGRGFPIISTFTGSTELMLANATFTQSLTGVATAFNVFSGQIVSTFNVGPATYNGGNLSFQTIEPVSRAAVPEPSTTIGLLAFGVLGFSQRKLFKRRRASELKNSSKNSL